MRHAEARMKGPDWSARGYSLARLDRNEESLACYKKGP